MSYSNTSLFEKEKDLLKDAKDLIESKCFDQKTLIDKFREVTEQFGKLLNDIEKIIKISDGQQEYLHRVQNDLKKEIEDRTRAEERLKYFAAIDSLTGVFNRGMGLTLLENEINSIRRRDGLFSVCFIDVNGLKNVNDNFGHFEGDELLVLVCNFIKEVISEKDILCRLGGDEFIIMFPDSNKDKAELKIKRVLSNISEKNGANYKPYEISFSYGIVQVNSDNKKCIDEIIQAADEKMYKHKQKYKCKCNC